MVNPVGLSTIRKAIEHLFVHPNAYAALADLKRKKQQK